VRRCISTGYVELKFPQSLRSLRHAPPRNSAAIPSSSRLAGAAHPRPRCQRIPVTAHEKWSAGCGGGIGTPDEQLLRRRQRMPCVAGPGEEVGHAGCRRLRPFDAHRRGAGETPESPRARGACAPAISIRSRSDHAPARIGAVIPTVRPNGSRTRNAGGRSEDPGPGVRPGVGRRGGS
jgi:hypothetical protein